MASAALLAAVAIGAVLRLSDAMANPVVPAEDPYTHMALVREHLRTGALDPLNARETVYPPGLHGFMAAAAVFTGADLYDLTLFGPAILGAIGILGLGLLLWRTAGPVAGFVGALALAVAPEAIFRTTMMSPTALDLAILPFFLYALLRMLAGRIGWVGVAAPMAVFLALAHPWLLAILSAAGFVFLVSAVAMPWRPASGTALSLLGAALCIAVLGASLGIALTMPTFGFVLPLPDGVELAPIGFAVAGLALVPAVAIALARRRGWSRRSLPIRLAPIWVRACLSLAIAGVLAATWTAASNQGMPEFVDLPRMVGLPILALAVAALVALPFIATPVANLAAALAAVTIPFVVFNPLHSEFLPHRTAIFLLVALAMLAGIAAGVATRATAHAFALRSNAAAPSSTPPSTSAPARSRPPLAAARPLLIATLPALVVALLLGGSVYAGTPDAYPDGWYRLYNECELDALREIAAEADANPTMLVITGDWQSKLVLAALTEDSSRVGYIGEFFTMEQRRDPLVAQMAKEGRPIVVVTDRYLRVETPDADTVFLSSEPWQPAGAWCANMGVPQPRVMAYTTGTPGGAS
ncbi:MAG: hypothetical protein ACYC2H_05335 [Thermoplasmatota archaeon]